MPCSNSPRPSFARAAKLRALSYSFSYRHIFLAKHVFYSKQNTKEPKRYIYMRGAVHSNPARVLFCSKVRGMGFFELFNKNVNLPEPLQCEKCVSFSFFVKMGDLIVVL